MQRLQSLLENKDGFYRNGPNSDVGQQWLADVSSELEKVDKSLAREFDSLAQYTFLSLSSVTLDPIINRMIFIIRKGLSRGSISKSKSYGPGQQYDVYHDIKEILKQAKNEIFLIDPYADEEIFDLYFDKVEPKVRIRFLTTDKKLDKNLKTVISKFKAGAKRVFEARSSSRIHDRMLFIDEKDCWILSQSVKDAAKTKPTVLVPVDSVIDTKALYENIWKTADPI